MGIYVAPPKMITAETELAPSLYDRPMAGFSGLGYSYFGENPARGGDTPIQRISKWNSASSKGLKAGVDPWKVKGMYSDAGDIEFAKMLYRFQHDIQNCPSPSFGQDTTSTPSWDVTKRGYKNCSNRDGIMGAATMCKIVKTLKSGKGFWKNYWRENLDVGNNMQRFSDSSVCALNCNDIACSQRSTTNCPPCGSSTPAKSVVRGEKVPAGTIIGPKPAPKPKPGPQPQPRPLPVVDEGFDFSNPYFIGGAVILAGTLTYLLVGGKKKKK